MASPIRFINLAAAESVAAPPAPEQTEAELPKLPTPIIDVPQDKLDALRMWLDTRLRNLISELDDKQKEWSDYEESYRARGGSPKSFPFVGACADVIPAIAMAVDPIHARLDTGIFKQDPVFTLKGLRKSILPYVKALEAFIQFHVDNVWMLRQVSSPRILEMTKLGTLVLKTVYHRDIADVKGYDEDFNVVQRTQVRYSGPRIVGVSTGNFLYPADFEEVQDCPIVAERIRTTFWKLKQAERSGLIANVDAVRRMTTTEKTPLETKREEVEKHHDLRQFREDITVYECWFDFPIGRSDGDPTQPDGDDLPESLVALYDLHTRQFLRLQYNPYFNQRKPYVVIPFTKVNGSLGGLGLAEMTKPFQDAITRWHQMASDNAYLANIRMYIAKKDSGIEQVPRLYAGRMFFVDDPTKDFIPFRAGDIYPSTLTERQNLFGMLEKRTGVSDYLTGRESPIIGTRATATSTLALIQEGTKRVEQVMENLRHGFAEAIQNCIDIWIQFGLGDVDDLVFGDDEIGRLVKEFFDTKVSHLNVRGAVAIDLTTTDAAGSRQVQQQMQLSIIQVMMTYLEKVLAAGQAALTAQQQLPQYTAMVIEVMTAARQMFRDLLQKYDIRNPDDYLPDLEKFLNGQAGAQQGGGAGVAGAVGGLGAPTGVPALPPLNPGAAGASPQGIGASLGPFGNVALAGPRAGT